VRIVVDLSSDLIVVRIEDDGPGFSPDVVELLGEPYLSSQPTGGLGLGVFIAQTLLARTGAALQFANLGKGARVTITWHRAALEAHAPEL
jgi:two-component system sensor histidine kinase RegB